jgi:hypothetical protein
MSTSRTAARPTPPGKDVVRHSRRVYHRSAVLSTKQRDPRAQRQVRGRTGRRREVHPPQGNGGARHSHSLYDCGEVLNRSAPTRPGNDDAHHSHSVHDRDEVLNRCAPTSRRTGAGATAALHGLKRYAITAPHCYCNPYGELSGGAGTTTRSRPTSAGSGCLTTRAAPSRFSQ